MLGSLKIRAAALAAAVVLAAVAAPTAWAQDYDLSNVTNQWESPPSGATNLALTDDSVRTVTLPFNFFYFGQTFSTVSVGSNGYIQFGGTYNTLGNVTFPMSSTYDGFVPIVWDDLNPSSGGAVKHHTSGTAPNRRWTVTWDGVPRYSNSGSIYAQIHIYETTGRIVFAYDQTRGNWLSLSYTMGINSPSGDTRYVAINTSSTNSARPPNDYQFDPSVTLFSGQVLLDEVLTDQNGIGSSQNSAQPAAFVRVELLAGTTVVANGFTDENGEYDMGGLALRSSGTGSIQVVSESPAGAVRETAGGKTSTKTIASGVAFGANATIPTYTISDANDATFAMRRPLQAAMSAGRAWAYVTEHAGASVPPLDFIYDVNSGSGSTYTPTNGLVAASARIGAVLSGNDDALDPPVIMRLWAHHAVANATVAPTTPYAGGLDRVSTDQNAFAEGLGSWLYSVITGNTVQYDGTSASTASSFNIETPSLGAGKAPDVAGWVAAALWDLSDAANEDHDRIDGTGSAADRPILVVGALNAEPTGPRFLAEWTAQGFDTYGLVRDFVFHGVLRDDAFELNDFFDEAADLGPAGNRLDGLKLQPDSEDWFMVNLPSSTIGLFADMTYDRFNEPAVVTLQITTPTGTPIATGVPNGSTGPIQVATGALSAGDYLVRVAHTSGPPITSYRLQIFSALTILGPVTPEWTAGRPLNQTFTLSGGIPPYTISVKSPNSLPTGLVLTANPPALGGSVASPGLISFPITVEDSGAPVHTAQLGRTIRINPPLAFAAPELTGVPLDKQTLISLGRTGGTPPFAVSDLVGTLPPGLAFDPATFEIIGTAQVAGGEKLSIEASDVAGSTAELNTQIVVCLPFEGKSTNALMDAGDASAGFYFDAIGTTVTDITVGTLRKREKRELRLILIGPDGGEVEGGKLTTRKGKVVLKGVELADTGRYYAAVGSETGGETTLVGKLKEKQPTTFKGSEKNLGLESEVIITFPAVEGATFDLKGRTTGGLGMRVEYLIAPDETLIGGALLDTTEKGSSLKVSGTLDQSGVYTMRLVPKPGKRGNFKYTLKIKNPKDFEYSAD